MSIALLCQENECIVDVNGREIRVNRSVFDSLIEKRRHAILGMLGATPDELVKHGAEIKDLVDQGVAPNEFGDRNYMLQARNRAITTLTSEIYIPF